VGVEVVMDRATEATIEQRAAWEAYSRGEPVRDRHLYAIAEGDRAIARMSDRPTQASIDAAWRRGVDSVLGRRVIRLIAAPGTP
jgi:hypothetical protein